MLDLSGSLALASLHVLTQRPVLGGTCLHMPAPRLRGHSDTLLSVLRLGEDFSQSQLTAYWTAGDTESHEENWVMVQIGDGRDPHSSVQPS